MAERKYVDILKIKKYWKSELLNNIDYYMALGIQDSHIENIEDSEYVCFACGSKRSLEKVHITPFSSGGECEESNLFLLCKKCHRDAPNHRNKEYFFKWVFKQLYFLDKEFNSLFKTMMNVINEIGLENTNMDIEEVLMKINMQFYNNDIQMVRGSNNESTREAILIEAFKKK